MERWEPPIAPETASRREEPGGRRTVALQDRWPEALELAGGRIAVSLFFFVGSSERAPGLWLLIGGPALVLVLIGLGALGSTLGSRRSRAVWIADGVTVGVFTPLLIVNAFAGVGEASLSAQERSIYLETTAVALLLLAGLGAIAWSRLDGPLLALSVLPAAMTTLAIGLAEDNFRTASVATALSLAWLVAAAATIGANLSRPSTSRVFAPAGLALFTVAALAINPGAATLGGRHNLVSLIQPMLILASAVPVLLPELRLTAPPRRRSREAPVARRRQPRRSRRP